MIRKLTLVLALATLTAQADPSPVSLRLQEVKVSDLVKVVFTDTLQKSFILDQELVQSTDVVTLDLRTIAPAQLEKHLIAVLESRGFQVQERSGVVFITKRQEGIGEIDTLVYRPKHRPVSYLMDLCGPLFKREGFTTQRAFQSNNNTQPQTTTKAQETGTNALSFIDKAERDTIVFQGTAKETERLQKLLQQLDKPAGEVLVKAVVYEVRKDKSDSNAVTLALGLIESAKGLGITITNATDVNNGIKIKASNIDAVWSALSGDSRFKLVSAPTVRIKSGGKARFMAGSEVPVLGAVSYQGVSGEPVRSVEYKPAGVILDLSPQIRDGTTDLTINQQISSFVPTTTGVNDTPTLLKRELSTEVSVTGEEVIILGGLDESTENAATSGLSFLPDFLQGTSSKDQKTEIMLMMHVERI